MFKYNRGFTLIELMIVVALLGVVLMLAIPRMDDKPFSDNLNTGVRQTINIIRYVRDRAIQEQVPYLLHFELGSNIILAEPNIATNKEESTKAEAEGDKSKDPKGAGRADDSGDFEESKESAKPAISPPKTFQLPSGVQIADIVRKISRQNATDPSVVNFTKKGYVEPVVIYLEGDDERTYTIVLTPFLATIKALEGYVNVEDT